MATSTCSSPFYSLSFCHALRVLFACSCELPVCLSLVYTPVIHRLHDGTPPSVIPSTFRRLLVHYALFSFRFIHGSLVVS